MNEKFRTHDLLGPYDAVVISCIALAYVCSTVDCYNTMSCLHLIYNTPITLALQVSKLYGNYNNALSSQFRTFSSLLRQKIYIITYGVTKSPRKNTILSL